MKIEQCWWFTTFTGTTVGIVKTKDENTGEIKFRIGTGFGLDENQDAQKIALEGDKFFPGDVK